MDDSRRSQESIILGQWLKKLFSDRIWLGLALDRDGRDDERMRLSQIISHLQMMLLVLQKMMVSHFNLFLRFKAS